MTIYIGADHRGFELKGKLKTFLQESGYQIVDVGNAVYDKDDDYPDFGSAVASSVSAEYETARGIIICGSGVGVCVVANKFPRVRAAIAFSSDQAFDSRNDDDANIICLAANYVDADAARRIVATWLGTPFSDEARHRRRLDKISALEIHLRGEDKSDD